MAKEEDQAFQIYRNAFEIAVHNLAGTLKEAQHFLTRSEHGAAIGTMLMFDEYAEDMKAALRLFQRAWQSQRSML